MKYLNVSPAIELINKKSLLKTILYNFAHTRFTCYVRDQLVLLSSLNVIHWWIQEKYSILPDRGTN